MYPCLLCLTRLRSSSRTHCVGITAQRPAAAAADQPSFWGLTPFGLAPLRSAAQRGINSPPGCLLGGSGSGPSGDKMVESLFICFKPTAKKGTKFPQAHSMHRL